MFKYLLCIFKTFFYEEFENLVALLQKGFELYNYIII